MLSKPVKRLASPGRLVATMGLVGEATAIVAMMLLISVDVTSRLSGHPVMGAVEMTQVFMVALAFLGLGHGQRLGHHVSVEVVMQRFSPRVQERVNVAVTFLSLVFFLIMTWQGTAMTNYAYETQKSWWNLPFGLWIAYLFVPVGGFMIMIELLDELIHQIKRLSRREEQRRAVRKGTGS